MKVQEKQQKATKKFLEERTVTNKIIWKANEKVDGEESYYWESEDEVRMETNNAWLEETIYIIIM